MFEFKFDWKKIDWQQVAIFVSEISLWLSIFLLIDELTNGNKRRKAAKDFDAFVESLLREGKLNVTQNTADIKKLQVLFNKLYHETPEEQKKRLDANTAAVMRKKAAEEAKIKAEEEAKIAAAKAVEESKHDETPLPDVEV